MRKSEGIGSIETVNDITCAREDFIAAARIFDDAEENISTAIAREEERWGTHAKVARILRIIRGRASTHNIVSGTPSSSDQILQSLAGSKTMQIRGIAEYVSRILNGPINSTPDNTLGPIIRKLKKPNDGYTLSLMNIKVLAKISLEEYCVHELLSFFKIDNVSMSGHLKRLEDRGYIERYKKPGEDQRKYYVRITAKGKRLIEKIEGELQKTAT